MVAAVNLIALSLFAGGCRADRASAPPHPLPAVEPLPASLPVAPVTAAGAASTLAPQPAPSGPIEVFPHVRIDRAARFVEFDAKAAVDAHDPVSPRVYLEVVCCTPDTREHEALVVTAARPAHIHAALLMLGLEPGAPGLVDFRGPRVVGRPPTGAGLTLEFHWRDAAGTARRATSEDWIVSIETDKPFAPIPLGGADAPVPGVWGETGGWVFAGSRFVTRRDPVTGEPREVYDADGTGVVIGLTTFGSEMIAWRQVLSPESTITAPTWVIRNPAYPRLGTHVVVRVGAESM